MLSQPAPPLPSSFLFLPPSEQGEESQVQEGVHFSKHFLFSPIFSPFLFPWTLHRGRLMIRGRVSGTPDGRFLFSYFSVFLSFARPRVIEEGYGVPR